MLPEAALAQRFRRVEYRYHRDFFERLGYSLIAAQFADIWKLCEPHVAQEPHEPLVDGQEPEHWLPYLEEGPARLRFFNYLANVLEQEAEGDEERGRPVLASKLRAVVTTLRAM